MPQTYRRTKHFSSHYGHLVDQLKLCDEAGIANQITDENLEYNWGVDAVRRLRDWDIPGCLSAAVFEVLQAFGEEYRKVSDTSSRSALLQYVAVISGESDHNDTWRSRFDCDDWTVQMSPRSHGDTRLWVRNTNTLRRLVSIPFYAEGFSAHLVVQVVSQLAKSEYTSKLEHHPWKDKTVEHMNKVKDTPFYLS